MEKSVAVFKYNSLNDVTIQRQMKQQSKGK